MPQALPNDETPLYDLVGVGFGPANLALAIALTEYNQRPGTGALTALFLERQPRFGWHRGMLIDDATMQVSFLKDLVTLRNPVSEFTFLNYLHDRDRLVDFINHKSLFPLRTEFHDYLEWAAAKLGDLIRYGQEVHTVRPVSVEGSLTHFDVETAPTGNAAPRRVYRARNVVIATGLRPRMPEGATPSQRVWHTSDLLTGAETLATPEPSRLVIVGAGQSAAEATAYLHRRFSRAEICTVFSRYGYSPSDDSSFANRIFDPAAVDGFYQASGETKRKLMEYHGNTNYSVVDTELIDDLYRRRYQEKVSGVERLRLFNVARVSEAVEDGAGVRVTVESLTSGDKTVLDADALVYATGYLPADPFPLLGDLAHRCPRDEEGRPRVHRDYRLVTPPEVTGGIYLQGGTEHTHGITSSLLSNAAVRAGEILAAITAHQPETRPTQPASSGATS